MTMTLDVMTMTSEARLQDGDVDDDARRQTMTLGARKRHGDDDDARNERRGRTVMTTAAGSSRQALTTTTAGTRRQDTESLDTTSSVQDKVLVTSQVQDGGLFSTKRSIGLQ